MTISNDTTFNAKIYKRKFQKEHYIKFMLSDMLNSDNFIINTDWHIIDTVYCDVDFQCIPEYFNNFTFVEKDSHESSRFKGSYFIQIKSEIKKEYEQKGLYIGVIREKLPNLYAQIIYTTSIVLV